MRLCILLITVVCGQVSDAYKDKDLISEIEETNSRFPSETNVFFDFDDCLLDKSPFSLRVPNIVITQEVDFQFIYTLDKNILAVVCISYNSSTKIKRSLSHVLHRMHHVNIMFIIFDSADPYPIFQWAWKNGYTNTVALYWLEGVPRLSEFYPFPKLTVVNIKHINESSLLKPITNNFHLHPIRTPIGNDPPRAFRYVNRQGKLIYSGLFLKAFMLFVDHYNATVQEVFLPDPYPNALLLSDMVDAVKDGKIEINLHPFVQLYDEYLCTYGYEIFFYYLMVPYSKPVNQFMYFVLPFDNWTWAGIAALLLSFAILIFFGSRTVIKNFDFGLALLQAISGLLYISLEIRSYKSKILLVIYISLLVVGLMLSNLYLAHLSTFLTTRVYEKQINSIEDAIASKLPISVDIFNKGVYEKHGILSKVLDQIEIIDIETWNHQRRILNTSRMDILSEEKYSFYAHQQRYLRTPRVKLIEEPVFSLTPSFTFPFTSPYADLYSDFFMRIYEAGIYKKFKADLNDDGIANGLIAFIEPDAPELVPLSLEHFGITLFLLGGGFAVAAFCFCVEIGFHFINL